MCHSQGLLLAVSGGPDSTALLLLVDRWRKTRGVPVTVATVDHRLREGSAREAAVVAALCAARELPHRTLVWEGASIRTRVLERARHARYALLSDCAQDIGADTIVTAHHADDQAETILMRLTRGSGPAGLAGMAPVSRRGRMGLARPLLGVPKAALVALCKREGVAFVTDPTNMDAKFRRPVLRALAKTLADQGLDETALVRLGARAARAEAALQWAETLARARLHMRRVNKTISFAAADFAALPREIGLRILARELAGLAPDAASPRLERLERLLEGLSGALSSDARFAATLGGCVVRLSTGVVTLSLTPARRMPLREAVPTEAVPEDAAAVTPQRPARNTQHGEDSRYLYPGAVLGNTATDP